MTIQFTLPMPPSINRTYKVGQGRFYKDNGATAWSTEAQWYMKAEGVQKLPEGRYGLSIWFDGLRKNADLDNRVKIIQDTLQAAGIIENDKHIDELHLYRGTPGPAALIHVAITLLENK